MKIKCFTLGQLQLIQTPKCYFHHFKLFVLLTEQRDKQRPMNYLDSIQEERIMFSKFLLLRTLTLTPGVFSKNEKPWYLLLKKKVYKLVQFFNGKTWPYGRDVRNMKLCQQDNQPSFTWPAIPDNWQAKSISAAAVTMAPNPTKRAWKRNKTNQKKEPLRDWIHKFGI